MSTSFLVSTRDKSQVEWLQNSLAALGQVVEAEGGVEELTRLTDLMQVPVAFISVDRHQQMQQCALIESLLEVRPMVAVVAIGDGYDSELVISAMRAGARDFITVGQRGSEVQGLVRRQLTRLPQPAQLGGAHADVVVVYGAQADVDASLLATHLALGLAETSDDEVLLIDIGLPAGESKAVLGLECTFHFSDAVRNLRRLDAGVIDSAFAHHDSGLALLPLDDEAFQLDRVNSAELFLLLGNLKQHFSRLVINLTGQRDSGTVRTLVSGANKVLWYADQSVSGNRRSLNLLQQWRQEGVKLDQASLLVDRYIANVAPDANALAKTFAMPLGGSFALSPKERLECRNRGKDLFALAPSDALTKALDKLVRECGGAMLHKRSFWQRLRG
jgi:pilus assembly protein CpaE